MLFLRLLLAEFFDGCLRLANHVHLLVDELDVAAICLDLHVFFDPSHNLAKSSSQRGSNETRLTSAASAMFSLSPKCPIEQSRKLAHGSVELFKQSN